jgi:hypothetical protein
LFKCSDLDSNDREDFFHLPKISQGIRHPKIGDTDLAPREGAKAAAAAAAAAALMFSTMGCRDMAALSMFLFLF